MADQNQEALAGRDFTVGKNIPENIAHAENITEISVSDQLSEQKRNLLSGKINNNKIPNPNPFLLLSSRDIIQEMNELWEYIDFEELGVSEEKEAFRSHSLTAFGKINSILLQAQQSPEAHRLGPRNNKHLQSLDEDIFRNVNHIWETEMQGVFNGENISLEIFLQRVVNAKILKNKKEVSDGLLGNDKTGEYYKEFIAKGHSDEEWEEARSEMVQINQKERKDKIKKVVDDKIFFGVVEASKEIMLTPEFKTTDYIDAFGKFLIQETHENGEFSHLVTGTMNESFSEVIQFLQGSRKNISADAYRAMLALSKDGERKKERSDWVDRKVKKVGTRFEKYEKNKNKKVSVDNTSIYKSVQQDIFTSDQLYQLGMQKLATDALEKMGKNPENFIDAENPKEIVDFWEARSSSLDGYTVKNKHTDKADSSVDAQKSGRISVEYLVMDKFIGTGGIIVAVANALIAFRTGQWATSMPYIAGGIGLNYYVYNGFFNSGFNKMLHPDEMLNNIVQESFGNKNYPAYFGNPWELALAKAIEWPADKKNAKGMKSDFKKIKKSQKKTTIANIDDETGEISNERKFSFLKPDDRRKKAYFEENITPVHFEEGGTLAKYLPEGNIPGPNGHMHSKKDFLDQVYENEGQSGMNGHIRYEMLNKIAGRIGKKDSYLPILDQLHQHYLPQQKTKKVDNQLDLFRKKSDTYPYKKIAN